MPKRIKQRRPNDVNQAAFRMVQMATDAEEAEQRQEKIAKPKVTKSEISRVMSALGTKGGRIGGKRRLKTMTPEQRSQAALKAAKARWDKGKKD